MRQLIESIIDVGSGLLIATLLQLYVFPFFGMYPTVWESFNIAVIFMCVSIFRSWLWRLVFVRFKNETKEIKETTQSQNGCAKDTRNGKIIISIIVSWLQGWLILTLK